MGWPTPSGPAAAQLRFKAKDQAQAGAAKPRAPAADGMDDDIPF
jgi:hypothetical protein